MQRHVVQKNLLILGGNGFIGAESVKLILKQNPETNLYLVNRGRSWDWDKEGEIKNMVVNVKHDRRKPFSHCSKIEKLLSVHWDAVIDFSGFEPRMVEDSITTFAYKTGLYVYISTDSVYEVCAEKTHSGSSREEDSVRPTCSAERSRLAKLDEYGDEKLQCEEVIKKYLGENGKELESSACRYIVLRLADVVGPRDGTDRFWQYLLWSKIAAETKIHVLLPRKYEKQKLSFVYVSDVAELIVKLVFVVNDSSVFNQEYNLACLETPTLDELISDIQESSRLTITGRTLSKYEDSENIPEIYPSVDRGTIDVTRAQQKLSWSPTPWKQVVQQTVNFYEGVNQSNAFVEEKKAVYKDMKKDISDLYSKTQVRCLKKTLKLDSS